MTTLSNKQFLCETFVLVPLTPVHVGGGEEAKWLPQDYRFADGYLERLALRRILHDLPEAERTQYIDMMMKDARRAIEKLQQKAQPQHVLERIPVHAETHNSLAGGKGDRRKGQIDGFIRAADRPFIPGSSLKGVLRTAWMAHCWQQQPHAQKLRNHAELEQQAFHLAAGRYRQDTDPFRDVMVRDAALPEGATRIDPVSSWKRKEGSYTFDGVGQMHRERLRSVADGGTPPLIEVEIGLRLKAVRLLREKLAKSGDHKVPACSPDAFDTLLAALEKHHALLWQREVEEKFFKGEAGQRLRDALALFNAFRHGGSSPQAALIRLGWASHAESKSIAGLRRIQQKVGKKPRTVQEGGTRHVINLNGHPLPFGWALLIRKSAWDAGKDSVVWLKAALPRATSQPTEEVRDIQETRVSSTQVLFEKGEMVQAEGEPARLEETISKAHKPDDKVRVDFGGGDIDFVKVKDIRKT